MSEQEALLQRMRRRLVDSDGSYDSTAIATALRQEAPTAGAATLLAVDESLRSEIGGAGVLEPLLREPGVTDVLVNGAGSVWVDRGHGPERSTLTIPDEAAARRLAVRLVSAGGRRLDDASAFADARLPDGTRVHAVLPPLSPQGTCVSLRVPPRRTFTFDDLIAAGSISKAGAELLRRLVAGRAAFLVTGGTGSGKTTVLSTLLSQIDPSERLVLVEDAAELRPTLPHVVRLEARAANAEGVGAVTLEVLVRQALRMRPDRLVVGEVRGNEVLDLLAALNTGHDGGCGTIHANRAEHLPPRIESLCSRAGVPREAAHSLLVAAVDAVVHVVRDCGGRRRIAGIGALVADPDGRARVLPAYEFRAMEVVAGPGCGRADPPAGPPVLTEWIAALSVTVAIARSGRPPPVSRIAALCGPVADQVHLGGRGSTWLFASVAGSAVVALGIAPSLVAVLVVGCVVCRRLFRSRQAAAGRAACTLATVEVTFALAGELRAGRTPAQALAAVAETAGPLRLALIAVQSAVAVGADVSTELMAASDLPGAERLRWVAAAWSVAESAGGRVATVLERLSESMDNDNELRQELDAAMAAPRATIVLLAGLPVLGLLLGQAVGAHPVALLIHRPLGWGLLGVALILDTAGVVVTRAIARRALGP